jgi:hypothetical protein
MHISRDSFWLNSDVLFHNACEKPPGFPASTSAAGQRKTELGEKMKVHRTSGDLMITAAPFADLLSFVEEAKVSWGHIL